MDGFPIPAPLGATCGCPIPSAGPASFSRLILFDKRGTGLSDPVPVDQLPSCSKQRMDDVRAVIFHAAGSLERAALMGDLRGRPMNLPLRRYSPQRHRRTPESKATRACRRRLTTSPPGAREPHSRNTTTCSSGPPPAVGRASRHWGPSRASRQGRSADALRVVEPQAPSGSSAPRSPSCDGSPAATFARPVREPDPDPYTIFISTRTRTLCQCSQLYLAQHIQGANFWPITATGPLNFIGDADAMLDEIQEFLTGTREPGEPDDPRDRVFRRYRRLHQRAAQLGHHRLHELPRATTSSRAES